MFGIPCGSYCFTRHTERSPFITITNRRKLTSQFEQTGSYEEIELKCHNNLGDSRTELLYLNGRYYRRLPARACREHPARRKLKLQLPAASQPDELEPPRDLGSHTNEQLNRISIIDVTNDDNSYEEPPIEPPTILEVDAPPPPSGSELLPVSGGCQVVVVGSPQAEVAPDQTTSACGEQKQETEPPSEQLQLVKQVDLPPSPVVDNEEPELVVAEVEEQKRRAVCKQPGGFVRRFHEMLNLRHQQQQIPEEPFTVMISYVHAEAQKYALSLKKELKRLGLSVYLDLHEIEKGSDWQDSLNRAVLSCEAFVPLITPSYGQTLWTGREIKLADVLAKQIIPVNFGQRWPPQALAIQFATIQYVSWLAPDQTNPNARPLMRTFKLRRRAGEVMEQSHWHKSCVRSVARQIKQAIERRQMRLSALAADRLPAEAASQSCQCRQNGVSQLQMGASSHDSGFSDSSSPILLAGGGGGGYCRQATSCGLIQASRNTSENNNNTNYGSFRPAPSDFVSLSWLKSSLDGRPSQESDSYEEDSNDEDDELDDDRPEVSTPDSSIGNVSANLLAVATVNSISEAIEEGPPEGKRTSQKKRKNSSSSSLATTQKHVSKFFTKFKKTLAKR